MAVDKSLGAVWSPYTIYLTVESSVWEESCFGYGNTSANHIRRAVFPYTTMAIGGASYPAEKEPNPIGDLIKSELEER